MLFPGKSTTQKSEELIHLKADNHCQRLLMGAIREGSGADITLIAEEKRIRAHKAILRQASRYFENNLEENTAVDSIYEVKLNNLRFDDLSRLIAYMYCGEISVKTSDLQRLLGAAEFLGMQIKAPVTNKHKTNDSEMAEACTNEPVTKKNNNNNNNNNNSNNNNNEISTKNEISEIEKKENEKNSKKRSIKRNSELKKKSFGKSVLKEIRTGLLAILSFVY